MTARRSVTHTLATVAVRGAHRLYSASAHERRYLRAVAAAHDTVPYYRERWVHGIGASDREPTPAADLDRQLARLFPIARPLAARGELPPWLGDPRELFEALLLTECYDPSDPLVEVRRALLDWRHLGPGRIGRYGVVLAPDAIAVPGVPPLPTGIGAPRQISLLGTPAELAAIEPAIECRARRFVRATLGGEPVSADDPSPALLFDGHPGYVGARPSSCGEWHLNWRRVHCRETDMGLAFTKLAQRRPTLVDVVPEQGWFRAVAACPVHGSPVLVA